MSDKELKLPIVVQEGPAGESRGEEPRRESRLPAGNQVKGRYAFVSLGCPKNLVDSERMLGLLRLDGYELVDDPDGADFVVVNTCGFIEEARRESFGAIDEMLRLKRDGATRGVIVTGCLAERQKEKLLEERPEIDSLAGVFGRDEITRIADRLMGRQQEQRTVFRPAPIRALSDRDRFRITPRHFAYLKISEGCDRLCTFCAIPKMRGKHASKPLEEVVSEAEELAGGGVRELIVVAQDTTYYGLDLYGRPRLTELLAELERIDGLDWIRLMYFYPMYIDDRLIERIASSDKILPYLDMPLQHADDTMLRRMSRRVTRRETEALLDRLRARIPNLALRTTMITGFPGESEEMFESLVEFVRRRRFERLGVFTYSLEPDTPAAMLPGHVDERTKVARREALMGVQQEIAFEQNEARLGSRVEIILDGPVSERENVWIGRSSMDAPEVDAVIYVTGADEELGSGDIVECEVVAAQGYDLAAVPVGAVRRPRA